MSDFSSVDYDYVILGGGSAGCVLANRLSASPRNRVLLVEAGRDFAPGSEPADILDSYPMAAAFNPAYHWQELRVRRSHHRSNTEPRAEPVFMEQARVVGGGSSINAQLANRGSPEDYDEWASLGAKGWSWSEVLPYFRKLEWDQDVDDAYHGNDGPIGIRRVPEPEWTEFSRAVARALTASGLEQLDDQNGKYQDGWFPATISNQDEHRVSAAMGYLSADVRRRANLTIMSETLVETVTFDGARASGARVKRRGHSETVSGRRIVVSAGALHSPGILMRSGIGSAAHLREFGIAVIADRPGVGANLNEHPTLAVSAYLKPQARLLTPGRRHAHIGFRYSSGVADCGANDMYVSVTAKSSWHPVGIRTGSLLMWCNKSYSRGRVLLTGAAADAEPDVDFDMLSDWRDYERMADGVRRMAAHLNHPLVKEVASTPFPSSYSERVRRIGTVNTKNRILTTILATILDGPEPVRRAAIDYIITQGVRLETLLRDDKQLEDYVRTSVTGCWHPSGTCRMGAPDDPMAVTDPSGQVYGVAGLTVCDASIFPCVPRANTNIPTIMCAEKIADALLSDV